MKKNQTNLLQNFLKIWNIKGAYNNKNNLEKIGNLKNKIKCNRNNNNNDNNYNNNDNKYFWILLHKLPFKNQLHV